MSSEFLLFFILIFFIILSIKTHSKRYFESTAESSLTKILDINELHTLEYRYNSYTVVYATKYNMEVYDTYKSILETVVQDFLTANKTDFLSFEDFRSLKLSTAEEDNLYTGFLNLCTSKEDFDDLKEFLSKSRKNALKMITTEKYAVAYEGVITAGINKPIIFSIDKDQKIVTVIVPRAEIIDTNVSIPADSQNKSVIYSEKKYVCSDGWHKEAYRACRADLQEKLTLDMEFLNIATENAKDAIIALLRPFENQSGYIFNVTISLNKNLNKELNL